MSKKHTVSIESHSGMDKRFEMNFPGDLLVYVDYDDVDHDSVDAAVKALKEIVEKHWDEKVFKKYYIKEVMIRWGENEYDLQGDYEGGLEEYLSDHNFSEKEIKEIIEDYPPALCPG
jgi:hypothetical protein